MDPTACLERILNAWLDGRAHEFAEACTDLSDWLSQRRGGSMSVPITFDNAILAGMARAFYVTAWLEREERRKRRVSGDAMDAAPATPKRFYLAAAELWAKLEWLNGVPVYRLLDLARNADHRIDLDAEYERTFGHYLAMQAMGHGVSWFDDHARFELKVPHVESREL